jgi:dienelactone hydrolase
MLATRGTRAQIAAVNSPPRTPFLATETRRVVPRTARVVTLGLPGSVTAEVWLVLHGYGQLAPAFAASARWPVHAERAFVFPEALSRFYDAGPETPHSQAPVGASWMTREARDDDIADNLAYLDLIWGDILERAPAAGLCVLGFSQGGATAARWAEHRARQAVPPTRLVLWGSGMPPDVSLDGDAPLRRVRVEFVVGERDRWVTAERVDAERARIEGAGFPAAFHRFSGGHRLDDATLARLLD